jgi:hypothetical protein
MENSLANYFKKYLKIFRIIVLISIIVAFTSGFFPLGENKEYILLSLKCDMDTVVIKGYAKDKHSGYEKIYRYDLSLYMNDKLVQDINYYSPPLLKYFKDKYSSRIVYFGPEPSLEGSNTSGNSNKSWANKFSIYMSSTNFSESEYDRLVNCVEKNKNAVKDALSKKYTIKPSFFSEIYPVGVTKNDILMIAYGEPYSDLALKCDNDKDGWVTEIDPSGGVSSTFSKDQAKEFSSLGSIRLVDNREMWVTIDRGKGFESQYERLESCMLPNGDKFFDTYPPKDFVR